MNALLKGLTALVLLSGAAYGQVPSTNDTSDTTTANTGVGTGALGAGLGVWNTAVGYGALILNTGSYNTAVGLIALQQNKAGGANTAVGNSALAYNFSGSNNTATGSNALYLNDDTGSGASGNTADGANAMNNNTTGEFNTAVGWQALYGSLSGAQGTGSNNTGIGVNALYSYSTGSLNTAAGSYALYSNTAGNNNTASGYYSLYHSTGSSNIALGYNAGYNVTTGSNNIDIGNQGAASDNGIIRIGAPSTQKVVLIAGIVNSQITGSAVYVNANGRLGVLASSERYKTGIAPIGSDTAKLQELRPVKFHLKNEPHGAVQYGLIAEEVAKVYPELVIRDESGRIDGVRYDELAPMLLKEMQKQQGVIQAQADQIAVLNSKAQKFESQAAEIRDLEQQLAGIQAVLVKLQPKDQLVAQR